MIFFVNILLLIYSKKILLTLGFFGHFTIFGVLCENIIKLNTIL